MASASAGVAYIDFCPENTATPPTSNGCTVVNNGKGQFDVDCGDGVILGAKKGASATIDDISSSLSVPYTTMPVGAPVSIDKFITISGHPEWNFRATQFVNLTCTPPHFDAGLRERIRVRPSRYGRDSNRGFYRNPDRLRR